MTEQNVTAQVELITPGIAEQYLCLNIANRPVRKRVVDYYANQMRKGQWMLNGEAICFSKSGNLINGQHRLHAIIEYGKGVYFLVVRGCDDESFATYDTGQNRTNGDVFALAGVPNYNNISSIINKYLGLRYNLSPVSAGVDKTSGSRLKMEKNVTKRDLLSIYYNDSPMWQEIFKSADSLYNSVHLMTTSEIGGMMAFLHIDKKYDMNEAIYPFFDMLLNGNHVSNPVINLLRAKLINDKVNAKKMTSKMKSALIIKTWNCYISGRVMKTLSYNEDKEGRLKFI